MIIDFILTHFVMSSLERIELAFPVKNAFLKPISRAGSISLNMSLPTDLTSYGSIQKPCNCFPYQLNNIGDDFLCFYSSDHMQMDRLNPRVSRLFSDNISVIVGV
jgi:hypothetical protein